MLNRFKIEWECRRGMRELDEMIMPFYQQHFDQLNAQEQQSFITLLTYSDPELFRWLMRQEKAPTPELQQIVQTILQKVLA